MELKIIITNIFVTLQQEKIRLYCFIINSLIMIEEECHQKSFLLFLIG
jgi:hypothetical protein